MAVHDDRRHAMNSELLGPGLCRVVRAQVVNLQLVTRARDLAHDLRCLIAY